MVLPDKKGIIRFYQKIKNGEFYLSKYNADNTPNNSREEIKKVLEEICKNFNGKISDNDTRLAFKKSFVPFSEAKVLIFLEDHYIKGTIKPDGAEAKIHIKRGLFSDSERDLLSKIQDYLKKGYQVQVKPYS